ncbi:MAG: hypothetical protein IPL45_11030 [Actinomycetales bacterium]|nr:hypothetical protein [Actinomycetales bacterium]
MADLRDGFQGLVPQTQLDVETALKTGLLSLDANVLLNFYRYTPAARRALALVAKAAGERVWISNQAAREFWRNRHQAIDDRNAAQEDVLSSIEKARSSMDQSLNAWAKRSGVSAGTLAAVRSQLSATVAGLKSAVESQGEADETASYDVATDDVAKSLEQLLSGRVGDPLPPSEHIEAVAEGNRRAKAGLPPGYRDAEKADLGSADGAAGDYLVWRQSLREASRRGIPLVIVTDDEKDDWWRRHRTTFFGPREELVNECLKEASVQLFMLRPIQLIENSDLLGIAVDVEAKTDVELTTAKDANWSVEAVEELLSRLWSEDAVQHAVILTAAQNGGSISRDELYKVCGFEPDRMLRGFTRPTARITADLVEEGYIAEDVMAMLTPHYYKGVLAQEFTIPSEVAEILGRARARSPGTGTFEVSGQVAYPSET